MTRGDSRERSERGPRNSPPRSRPGREARQGGRRAEGFARRGSAKTASGQRALGERGGRLEEPLSRSMRAGAQAYAGPEGVGVAQERERDIRANKTAEAAREAIQGAVRSKGDGSQCSATTARQTVSRVEVGSQTAQLSTASEAG